MKSIIFFIFTFCSIASPLASIGLDFHLLDHHNHIELGHSDHDHHGDHHQESGHEEDQEHHSDNDEKNETVYTKVVKVLVTVGHDRSNHNEPHQHNRSIDGEVVNSGKIKLVLDSEILLLNLFSGQNQLISLSQSYLRKWQSISVTSYLPPPDNFRTLPLII